ncbi:MAG: LysM peptidoglycan-binding domain-containing protein [Bacteroidota bacterium]
MKFTTHLYQPSLLLMLLLSFSSFAFAQCPPSVEDGVHVVQTNETLSAIGRTYGVSVSQLMTWNSIASGEVLQPCRELVVSTRLVTPAPQGFGATLSNTRQSGKWHTVRPGETVESVAEIYGYTPWRFREFNHLESWRTLRAGAVVRSSACGCNTVDAPPAAEGTPSPTLASTPVSLGPAFNSPEVVGMDRANMKVSESRMIDAINQLRANPSGFINEVRAYVARENAKPWRRQPINAGKVNSLIQRLAQTPRLSILRAHPCLYRIAKTQGDYLKAYNRFDHADANGRYPWSRTKEGCPTVGMGTTKRPDGYVVGNENLVAGLEPLDAVISLLIDETAADNGHRETLLAPEWQYVTAYYFGTVMGIDNNYIQMFGR